ncbi:MAG TPA: ATP-binding protein, partial [Cyclobacteriaceae bacterium]|nr:ATP-binding protein [Cyclobacteriaceae bacterium]
MKFKLIVIYIFILIALSSVGIISYQGLTNMMNTLRLAVQPDERIGEITEFISLVHSGENYLRLYGITRLNDYYLAHERSMRELQDQLNRLYNASAGDPVITTGLDSIKLNLIMKIYFHDQLIRMKSVSIMPEMQHRILMEADSMESRISTRLEGIIKDSTGVAYPEERKGFLSWLFRSRKQPAINPVIIDSLLIRELAEIRISDPIRNTLEEFTEKESELNKRLMESELGYTVENTRLTEKMILAAGQISKHISEVSAAKAGAADILFSNTTKYIAWAGAISALLLLGMLLIITRDFQVILKTKKKLEETSKKAEQLAKAREDFLATMSHEIRTPLNSIIGLLKYVRTEAMTDTGKKFLGMIGNSSDHLLKVVNEILDYSKIEAGQLHFEKVWFNPWNLIYETAAVFQKEASDKNLDFSVEAEESLKSYIIQWDLVRLRQVIYNLISNAIKFTEKGQIKLKARLTGDSRLIIIVKDTGIGIRKDHLRKIFDEYSQVFSSQSKSYGGTGLGLSIVKKIIDLQGGEIRVESKVNSGSEFIVSIPVERSSADLSVLQEIAGSADLKNLSVLVADDDEYSLLMLSKILRAC